MSNVVPQDAKKRLGRIYRARLIISGSLIVIAVATLSALALLPSFLALGTTSATQEHSQASSSKEDLSAIARTQSLLNTLSPFVTSVTSTTTPHGIVSLALGLKGSGVHIDHITYASGQQNTLTLAGTADAPSDIAEYRRALEETPPFTSVDVPLGDLVGAKGGRFSMTLKGDF
ncbi:MAG: hypothetical protein U1D26_01180 [Patescibacteria group bacterium]|nr:hypothetical protein [bacterium]MDZ4227070.1 hypothetical protein [Patescibacteria group bacterium]